MSARWEARGLLELREAVLREGCVAHPRVAVAALLPDPAGPLEPVEEARDPRGGQQHLAGEVDPPQRVLGRVVELDEDVEVAQGQPVRGLEARSKAPA